MRGLFAYWPAWASLAIPMVLDPRVAVLALLHVCDPSLAARRSGSGVRVLVVDADLHPSFSVGLDTWLLPNHVERVVAGIAGQLAIIGLIVWSIRRRVGAGRAWLVFGITFLFMESLVGLTRVSS